MPPPMMTTAKATNISGALNTIENCELIIPSVPQILNGTKAGQIVFKSLPDISDSKSAVYNDEQIPGRSSPIKTFSHGENRSISVTASFYVIEEVDELRNLDILAAIRGAVYPMDRDKSMPYFPPPICKLKCGRLLSKGYLCVVMKSYSVKFDTSVPWGLKTYLPYKLEISMEFDVVYSSKSLPGSETIVNDA